MGSRRPRVEDRITAVAAATAWLVTRWLGSDFTGDDAPEAMADRLFAVTAELQGMAVAR